MKEKLRTRLLKFFSIGINFWLTIPTFIVKHLKKNPIEYLMLEICRYYNSNQDYFISYKSRLKKPAKAPFLLSSQIKDKFAIVIQGPIKIDDDFTLETVKFYKSVFSEAVIIVSTWRDEDEDQISRLKKAGALIVQSEKPQNPGMLNVNYQLISTKAGVEKANILGVDYICKTRSDQRIYRKNSFEFLINSLNTFPIKENNVQNKRIVVVSMNYGNIFHPYMVSDFFYFGSTLDIMNLFSIPLDSRNNERIPKMLTRREYSENRYAPEVYIIKSFIEFLGLKYENNIKDYWAFTKDRLLCIDNKMIGLYWPKYDYRYMEHNRDGDYFINDNNEKLMTYNFDYINWLNLYSGSLKYKSEYENYANVIFN